MIEGFDEIAHLTQIALCRAARFDAGEHWVRSVVLARGGSWDRLDPIAETRLRHLVEFLAYAVERDDGLWLHEPTSHPIGSSTMEAMVLDPRYLRMALDQLRQVHPW